MTQDSQVILVSTTTHGYLYTVYSKEDTERKRIKYTGEISDDSKLHKKRIVIEINTHPTNLSYFSFCILA